MCIIHIERRTKWNKCESKSHKKYSDAIDVEKLKHKKREKKKQNRMRQNGKQTIKN